MRKKDAENIQNDTEKKFPVLLVNDNKDIKVKND